MILTIHMKALDLGNPSTKRSHDAIDNREEHNAIDFLAGINEGKSLLFPGIDNCDEVRSKINSFINSGAMKVGDFQRAIGITSSSYSGFMRQDGPRAGAKNSTYRAASLFFHERKHEGLTMPNKKAKKAADAKGKETDKTMNYDVSDIHLDGEEEEEVEIYDTCDELRRKIAAHLRVPGMTQAAICRAMSTSFPESAGRKIQSKQLQEFQRKKGPLGGNSSGVFYGAYVFFEKLRIKQGKKKSKTREEMEQVWGNDGGVTRNMERGYWTSADSKIVQNRYGKVSSVRRKGR